MADLDITRMGAPIPRLPRMLIKLSQKIIEESSNEMPKGYGPWMQVTPSTRGRKSQNTTRKNQTDGGVKSKLYNSGSRFQSQEVILESDVEVRPIAEFTANQCKFIQDSSEDH